MNRPDWMLPTDAEIGFTGSREGMSPLQRKWVITSLIKEVVHNRVTRAHHGCCEGSDEEFHGIARGVMTQGLEGITLHPPIKNQHEMKYDEWTMMNCIWYPRKAYLARDRDIVTCTGSLLATPNTDRPTRGSGTWYTIQYARDLGNKNVHVCFPNGEIDPI